MKVSEHEREGGGHTTQFMDAAGDKELIISAWPYAQLDLTLGQEGSPNSASDQSDHLEIVDVLRDDTFTVLFQKNGVRHSVITLPEMKPGSPTSSPPGASPTSHAGNATSTSLFATTATSRQFLN